MRGTVTFTFNARQSIDIDTDIHPDAQAAIQARNWLEATWDRLGCEPLRPSGKVLLLDKILGVTDAFGYSELSVNPEQATELARNILLAVDAQRVTVDLPGLSVGF